MKFTTRLAVTLFFASMSQQVMALPIDWNGVLGFDTTLINNYRRTNDTVDKTGANHNGTQGIQDGDRGAHFQTYLFRLNPTIIVNDSVSVKGELSTGTIRGGFLGDNTTNNQSGTSANNSYFHSSPAQRSGLNINQAYAEMYADTALVKIGRYSRHFGLGAIVNGGNRTWDRFFTMYDGVQGEMKIGNFSLTPHWAKLSSYDSTNNTAQANGQYDVREMGLTAIYDNKNKEMKLGLTYSKRFSERRNSLYNSTQDGTPPTGFDRGVTEVTLFDAYIEKKFKNFRLGLEVPTMSGDYGHVYDATTKSRISTSAILFESAWNASNKWDFEFYAGQISGDKGQTDKFEATYLHPNYHIAELMFRYNYLAFSENQNNIFDASITNTRYFKFAANYKTDMWTWKTAFIMAKAREVASQGKKAYHHEENYRFTSAENQSDDMGHEVDFGFDYRWNPNVTLSGFLAYWFVGEYYAFTNTNKSLGLSNVLGSGLKVAVDF